MLWRHIQQNGKNVKKLKTGLIIKKVIMSIKIKTIEEFDTEIQRIKDKCKTGNLIFRGQSDSSWDIVSSAYRYLKKIYPTINVTKDILGYFESNVNKDVAKLRSNNKDFENRDRDWMMCTLQHLGGKSTFIDFSTDAHIALYFACEKLSQDKDGVVFVMTHDENNIYNNIGDVVGDFKSVSLDDNDLASKRLTMQKSCFLDSSNQPIILNNEDIDRVFIDKNCKNEILHRLNTEENIKRENVYPDMLEYIGNQGLTNNINSLKSVVFRETAQKIKDGCVRRIDDILRILNTLEKLEELSDPDKLRIKFLRARALMCTCKYDEALLVYDTISDDFVQFSRLNDQNDQNPDKNDAIDVFFVKKFEMAKCLMGKQNYEKALILFDEAKSIVDNKGVDLPTFEGYYPRDNNKMSLTEKWYVNLKCDIAKNKATCLVSMNKYNIHLAIDILKELQKNENLTDIKSDIANLYVKVEKWDEAISLLKEVGEEDYGLSMLANCYVEMSRKGNEKLYLEKAIEAYKKAIENLKPDENEYKQKTNDHDHHYQRARALSKCGRIEEAIEEYKMIILPPYENEDAMHEMAYLINQNNKSQAIEKFMDAILNSRVEKNPRNFNDLGKLIIELSIIEPNLIEILINGFRELKRKQDYPESVQIEFSTILDLLLELKEAKDKSKEQFTIKIAEHMFVIADLLNRKDAFANKNLGDIYYETYLQTSVSERVKHENAEKALRHYILANSYYLIDGKRCPEIENRIKELEGFLKRLITVVNE